MEWNKTEVGKAYHREYKKLYYQRRKHDPEFRAQRRKHQRARYYRRKAKDPEKLALAVKDNYVRLHYGITLADYDKMFAAQKGLCAICNEPETYRRNGVIIRLAVDHDHDTGAVRGLLCATCNKMLGYSGDDSQVLRAAASYLDVHRTTVS